MFSPTRSYGVAIAVAVLFTAIGPVMSGRPGEMSDAIKSKRRTQEPQFLFENEISMSKMMANMSTRPTGDIDRDFVRMMAPHHQGAVDMAKAETATKEQLRRLAQEIIITQQQEIMVMRMAIGENNAIAPSAPDGAMEMHLSSDDMLYDPMKLK